MLNQPAPAGARQFNEPGPLKGVATRY